MTETQDNQEHSNEPKSRGSDTKTPRRPRTMLVRYGNMGMVGHFSHNQSEIPSEVTHVLVTTERGMEIGEIISPTCHQKGTCTLSRETIDDYCRKSGPDYPLSRHGKVVRFASEQDLSEQRHIIKGVAHELKYCKELVKEMRLEMTLVDAEHLFGGERIVFYFMADGRVDFRELVKRLAQQYQTRIEMRQVGARDEARLIADFETCGRQCCCKNFLKILQPVNMRMAKLQKATLDPSKISGRCGRLKCCLRYEDEVYCELNKKLPRKNSWVLVDKGYGCVIDTQILTQLVRLRMSEGPIIAVNVNEIKEFNCSPSEQDLRAASKEEKPASPARTDKPGERKGRNDRGPSTGPAPKEPPAQSGNGSDKVEKKNTKSQSDSNESSEVKQVDGEQKAPDNNKQSESPTPRKRRRRRGRRRRRRSPDN